MFMSISYRRLEQMGKWPAPQTWVRNWLSQGKVPTGTNLAARFTAFPAVMTIKKLVRPQKLIFDIFSHKKFNKKSHASYFQMKAKGIIIR
jgi:hypothetical protein